MNMWQYFWRWKYTTLRYNKKTVKWFQKRKQTELHKQEQQLGIEFEQVQEQLERTLKTEVHGLLSLISNDSQYRKLYMN